MIHPELINLQSPPPILKCRKLFYYQPEIPPMLVPVLQTAIPEDIPAPLIEDISVGH